MSRINYKLVFLSVLLVCIFGCSSLPAAYNTENPGTLPRAGGELQFFFANPDYTTTDVLEREQLLQREIFGGRNGSPVVNGGIGMMGVWRF
ncbi:MAG: hypothetical protein AB9866_17410 [Syntrophobacteraceae bacterium]